MDFADSYDDADISISQSFGPPSANLGSGVETDAPYEFLIPEIGTTENGMTKVAVIKRITYVHYHALSREELAPPPPTISSTITLDARPTPLNYNTYDPAANLFSHGDVLFFDEVFNGNDNSTSVIELEIPTYHAALATTGERKEAVINRLWPFNRIYLHRIMHYGHVAGDSYYMRIYLNIRYRVILLPHLVAQQLMSRTKAKYGDPRQVGSNVFN